MRTCCICNGHWKEHENEKDFKNHSLIYGCRRCHKGYWESNNKKGYFDNFEFIKEKKK